jgi:hypothetical protein
MEYSAPCYALFKYTFETHRSTCQHDLRACQRVRLTLRYPLLISLLVHGWLSATIWSDSWLTYEYRRIDRSHPVGQLICRESD